MDALLIRVAKSSSSSAPDEAEDKEALSEADDWMTVDENDENFICDVGLTER